MDQVVSKRGQLLVHSMGLLVMLLLVPPLSYCILYIQFLNAFWGILLLMDLIWIRLNLLPILPFVGGRLGAALLDWLFPTFGDRISCLLSTATALLIAGYFLLYYNSWILGGYFLLLAWNSLQVSKLSREEVLDQTEYDQVLGKIEIAIQAARYDSALEMIRLIKQKLHEEERVSFLLLEQLTCKEAKILLLQQKPREAFEAISAAEEAGVKITIPELLIHKQLAAYKTSHFEESLKAGQAAFRKRPEAATALLLALTGGRLSQSAVVVAWLLAAKSLGVTDFTALEQLADFDAVRHEPEVQLLFKKSCRNP
jgi:hypothetical protein